MKSSKMERLKATLTFHAENLCLDDWVIKLRWATEKDQKICKKISKNKKGFWGMVHKINYDKRKAEIVINRDIKKPKEEEVMIHELFHIVVGGAQLTECRDEALTEGLTSMYEHIMDCPALNKCQSDCRGV